MLGPGNHTEVLWFGKYLEMRQNLSMTKSCLPFYLLIILWCHFRVYPLFEPGVSTQKGEKNAIKNDVVDSGELISLWYWALWSVRAAASISYWSP